MKKNPYFVVSGVIHSDLLLIDITRYFIFISNSKIIVSRTNLNAAVNGFLDSVVKTYGKGQATKLSAQSAPIRKGTREGYHKNKIFINRNETRSLSGKIFRKLR